MLSLVQGHVSIKLEISMAFLFRENRRHRTYGQTYKSTDSSVTVSEKRKLCSLHVYRPDRPMSTAGCSLTHSRKALYINCSMMLTQHFSFWENCGFPANVARNNPTGFKESANKLRQQSAFYFPKTSTVSGWYTLYCWQPLFVLSHNTFTHISIGQSLDGQHKCGQVTPSLQT